MQTRPWTVILNSRNEGRHHARVKAAMNDDGTWGKFLIIKDSLSPCERKRKLNDYERL